jgi:hypothetical protein
MAIQIGRFSFRGPFSNLDEIKNRPGLFIIHSNEVDVDFIVIKETALLLNTIECELSEQNLTLGENCLVSTYNTFCALSSDRKEMVSEIEEIIGKIQ